MSDFFSAVVRFPFLQNALCAGILGSIACGIVGTMVTVRRITSIAGAIAHSLLGGIGAAIYLRYRFGWDFITPMHGALTAGILAALIIGLLSIYAKQREDTVLSALWSVGMALGILFVYTTPGYATHLMSYLFGDILMVSGRDLWLMAGLDLVIIVFTVVYYFRLQAMSFDEEFTRLRGIRTNMLYMLLLCLSALCIVIMVHIVGIIMVIALLALPAATAAFLAHRLWAIMACAVGLSIVYTCGGVALSYGPDLPAGAVIILCAATVYLVTCIVHFIIKKTRARTS
jgi:zinc transport system permease protein